MRIEYNGVNLSVIDLQRYERTAVFSEDGADLLYVRHILGAVCTLAPGGDPRMVSATKISGNVKDRLDGKDRTSEILKGNPRGSEFPSFPTLELEEDLPGSTAVDQAVWHAGPETDAEIQNRLMIPRRKLILWAWDRQTGKPIRWLESPRQNFSVDATVGPTPISWDVVSASGEPNAVGIFFQIRTDVTPCPMGTDRFVLSHRWETTHGYNQDQYLTRQIEGQIIFHAGVRDALTAIPDLVRNQFIHPVPVGMQRLPVVIVGSSDGLTIRYTIYDIDPTIVFSPGDSGATQIEIAERVTVLSPLGDTLNFLPKAPFISEWLG